MTKLTDRRNELKTRLADVAGRLGTDSEHWAMASDALEEVEYDIAVSGLSWAARTVLPVLSGVPALHAANESAADCFCTIESTLRGALAALGAGALRRAVQVSGDAVLPDGVQFPDCSDGYAAMNGSRLVVRCRLSSSAYADLDTEALAYEDERGEEINRALGECCDGWDVSGDGWAPMDGRDYDVVWPISLDVEITTEDLRVFFLLD